MANDVKALVITGVGLNCEKETAAAFTSSGASATLIHINDLLSGKATMADLEKYALEKGEVTASLTSGRQEMLEAIMNEIMFSL